jgi:hypothetical protein
MNPHTTATVRDLLAELAQVEDAVRRVPTVAADAATSLSPELRSLMTRERDIVRELRRRRSQWRQTCAPGQSLESLTP